MSFALLASLALTAEAMPHAGECPDIPGISGFSMADFAAPLDGEDSAKWYERERDPWFMFEMGQECGTQESSVRRFVWLTTTEHNLMC